jgi:hypothetical protein
MKWKQQLPFTDLFSRRFDLTNFELAGLLAHRTFYCLPVAINRNSGGDCKKFYYGLQLRVQLRHQTGFPFQTRFQNRKLVNQDAAKVENK